MPPTQRRIKKESNFAYAQCKSIRFANIETYHKFIKRKFSKTGNFLFFRKKKVSENVNILIKTSAEYYIKIYLCNQLPADIRTKPEPQGNPTKLLKYR